MTSCPSPPCSAWSKSSGVVGVDEKYVLVPKNAKPAGKMRRWMYVYLAVDAWTYDLLHIAIYPNNDQDSAEAFLLALRAKGYHPQVIVTDLRQDYGPVIAQVFPQAVHHECIFHALQQAQKHVKDAYGPDYAEQHPAAEQLKQQIYHIFDAETLALATERYTAVLALRQDYVQARPEAAVIFDFLERHWPRLANSIGSSTDPGHQQHRRTASSAASTSITRTSAASSPSPMRSATWPSLRSSTAAPPSRKMPSPPSAVSARCNWPATTSASCPWRPSAPASALSGRYRPRRPHVSPARDGLRYGERNTLGTRREYEPTREIGYKCTLQKSTAGGWLRCKVPQGAGLINPGWSCCMRWRW